MFGSATPRPESWAALERLELGGRVGGDLPPVRSSICAARRGTRCRRRCSASSARVLEANGKAILLLNRRGDRAGAPLPGLRRARSAARTATSRSSSTATAGCAATTAATREPAPGDLPHLRLLRARAARRGHAVARAGARARVSRPRPDPARRRHRDEPGADVGDAAAASPRRAVRCCSERRWSPRATTSPGVELAAVDRRRHLARAARTSAPRSAPSSCSPSSPAAAAATRRDG